MRIILETARLTLREMNENDYVPLYAVLADSDIMQYYPGRKITFTVFRKNKKIVIPIVLDSPPAR